MGVTPIVSPRGSEQPPRNRKKNERLGISVRSDGEVRMKSWEHHDAGGVEGNIVS